MEGNHGYDGYIKFMTLQIIQVYVDYPFWFVISGRGWLVPTTFSLVFRAQNTINPPITHFVYNGVLTSSVFVHQPDTSVQIYDMYYYKSAWNPMSFYFYGGNKASNYNETRDLFKVTLKDEHVDTPPTENVTFPENYLKYNSEIISIKNRITTLENK